VSPEICVQVVKAVVLHQLLVLKQKRPVIKEQVLFPHIQKIVFDESPFEILQSVKAMVLH